MTTGLTATAGGAVISAHQGQLAGIRRAVRLYSPRGDSNNRTAQ